MHRKQLFEEQPSADDAKSTAGAMFMLTLMLMLILRPILNLMLMLNCWKVRVCTGSSSRGVQPGVNGADLLLEGLKMMLMMISMLMLLCK